MTDDIKSPLDRAVAARNRPGRHPAPDPRAISDTRVIEVPIDHNPDAVIGEGVSAQAAKSAMLGLWTTWNAVRTAAEDSSTDLQVLSRVAQQAVERGLSGVDRAVGTIQSHIGTLEREIEGVVCPCIPDALATEIRGHLASKRDFGTAMTEVRADPRVSSAVLSAPAFLSGLTGEQAQTARRAAVAAHAPELDADLQEARRALEKVTRAAERVTQTLAPKIHLWSNPEPTALRQLRTLADR